MSLLSEQAELLHSILSPVKDVVGRLHALVPTCAEIEELAAALGASIHSTSELHAKVKEATPRLDRVRADLGDALRLVEAMQHGEGYVPGVGSDAIGSGGGPGGLDPNLDVVLEQLGLTRSSIADAVRSAGPAHTQAEQVLEGAVEYAGGRLAELAQLLVDAVERIAAELGAIDRDLEESTTLAIAAKGTSGAGGGSSAPSRVISTAPERGPHTPDVKRLRELAADLPPPVVPRSGQKTHGRYVAHTDQYANADQVVSGADDLAAAAWDVLQRLGLAQRGRPFVVDHVEVKMATRMARDGITEATIVINNTICPGRFNCKYYGERILYEGTTLWVQTPSYRVPLRGRRKRDDST